MKKKILPLLIVTDILLLVLLFYIIQLTEALGFFIHEHVLVLGLRYPSTLAIPNRFLVIGIVLIQVVLLTYSIFVVYKHEKHGGSVNIE